MFIGRGLSLKSRCAAQADRQAANTATAAASAAYVAAAAAAERALSASPPFFALSPAPAEMDSIASLPTPTPINGTSPAIVGSLSPLVYDEDLIEGGWWQGGGALARRSR